MRPVMMLHVRRIRKIICLKEHSRRRDVVLPHLMLPQEVFLSLVITEDSVLTVVVVLGSDVIREATIR